MRRFAPLVLAIVLGCGPSTPTTAPNPPRPVSAVPVHWTVLVRDRNTLAKYVGVRVKIELEKHDYECSGGELRVWYSTRDVPPTIIIKMKAPQAVTGKIVVTGIVLEPVRDGVGRARNIDYCAHITDAEVTPHAP